jgi:sulfite reductase beta subunit-like hemoprotein
MTDKLIQIQNLNKILLRLNDLETRTVKLEMRFVRNTTNEDKYKNEIKSNKI